MGDWNGEVRCVQSASVSFTEGEIYEVINGYLNDNYCCTYGKYYNINKLNEVLASQFEEIVTVKDISKPKLCEILGVEVDERFKIDFKPRISKCDYYINNNGNLIQAGEAFDISANEFGVPLINSEYTILKLPFYQFDEDEIITLKALWLNGYEYIVRDDDDDLWAYDGMPKEDDGVYDNETEWDYAVKLNSDLFQQVQSDIILDISLELSKIN